MQVINSQAPVINLEAARTAVVNVAGKTGEVIKTYANALCQSFNIVDNQGNITTPWYERKGKDKKVVSDERALFVTAMKAAGFETPTIDVYWQRVKEASGRVKTTTKVTGGDIDVDAKTMADLKTVINRIFKAEENGETFKASEVKGALMGAYEFLGGEIDKLG